MKRKTVFILLTRLQNQSAKPLEILTGCYYTHASIGLEEDLNTFYSFVCKGFIVEKITRYLKAEREPFPCQLYALEVSAGVYKTLKGYLSSFERRRPLLRYSRLGVFLCLLQIPFHRKNHYFCSQFVAEVLSYSSAARLRKNSSLYLPKDLRQLPGLRLHFQGNLHGMAAYCGVAA